MKTKKKIIKSMCSQSQRVSGDEQGGNNFKCDGHNFEFIEVGVIECTECGYKTDV